MKQHLNHPHFEASRELAQWSEGIKKTWRDGDYYVGHLNMTQMHEVIDDAVRFMVHVWMPENYAKPRLELPEQYQWVHSKLYLTIQDRLTRLWSTAFSAFYHDAILPVMPKKGVRMSNAEALGVTGKIVAAMVVQVEMAFERGLYSVYDASERHMPDLTKLEVRELLYGACPRQHAASGLYTHERIRCQREREGTRTRHQRFLQMQAA